MIALCLPLTLLFFLRRVRPVVAINISVDCLLNTTLSLSRSSSSLLTTTTDGLTAVAESPMCLSVLDPTFLVCTPANNFYSSI